MEETRERLQQKPLSKNRSEQTPKAPRILALADALGPLVRVPPLPDQPLRHGEFPPPIHTLVFQTRRDDRAFDSRWRIAEPRDWRMIGILASWRPRVHSVPVPVPVPAPPLIPGSKEQ